MALWVKLLKRSIATICFTVAFVLFFSPCGCLGPGQSIAANQGPGHELDLNAMGKDITKISRAIRFKVMDINEKN